MNTPKGLAGVVVDTTAISDIDGERGTLSYRGHPIEQVVQWPFDEVARLLIGEGGGDRTLPAPVFAVLQAMPRQTHIMQVLQAALPLLDGSPADLAAKVPTLVAAWIRGETVHPDPRLPIHADFLRMMRGEAASAAEVALLDATQILQMEHGFNASTFTARVVASTLATLPVCLSAAVGALSGPLHGGADEAAYRMALAIGAPEHAPAWVDAALARRDKIMGLGHREYKVVDPRAKVLRTMAGDSIAVRTLAAVDDHASKRFAEQGKTIRANVEFYKGAVFAALGIAPEYFTGLFVMARVYGWCAHVLEQREDNKLYRPQARFVRAA